MDFIAFVASIKEKLEKPLPGLPAQLKMAGMRRLLRGGGMVIPDDAKKSAVLALFYPTNGKITLALIKRTEYPGVHSGQISFPGGGWEEHDRDLVDTALREAEEEIGVDRNAVTPIGKLTELFIPPSNFLVMPIVGYINERPYFRPDPEEVDSIIEIPLEEFLDDSNIREKDIMIFPSETRNVPSYYIDGHVIWGATAMIISELVEVIRN